MESNRDIWLDYLRSFLTVLVVAHHSSLVYTTFAIFDRNAYVNSTNPVVDAKRWIGLDIFENFNDIFFMSLMFFDWRFVPFQKHCKERCGLFCNRQSVPVVDSVFTSGDFLYADCTFSGLLHCKQ